MKGTYHDIYQSMLPQQAWMIYVACQRRGASIMRRMRSEDGI